MKISKENIKENARNWGYTGLVYTPESLEAHADKYGPHINEAGTVALVYFQGIINYFALRSSKMELEIKNTLMYKIYKLLRRKS